MKELDWSCKENILIKGFDGRLIPMSEPYFESRQIAPGTWQILSSGDCSYLLAGEGQGLLIDSGYGAGNIREYCEKLCGLPVPWIANTHEHFDHTANNCYFDLVFLTEKAHERATTPFKSFQGIDFPKDYPAQYVKTRDVIPLPGRELICQKSAFLSCTPGLSVLNWEIILPAALRFWIRKIISSSAEMKYGRPSHCGHPPQSLEGSWKPFPNIGTGLIFSMQGTANTVQAWWISCSSAASGRLREIWACLRRKTWGCWDSGRTGSPMEP